MMKEIYDRVSITGDDVSIADNVDIEDDVIIKAHKIRIGYGTKIEKRSVYKLCGKDSEFIIGDNCLLGHDNKVLVNKFKAGDYCNIHHHLLCNGTKSCTLGSNVFIGSNAILNAADDLTIGNGCSVATYNSVWTHGGHGERLEGCLLYKVAPTVLEDDVWLVGSYNVVYPGVRIGYRSIVMTGSIVTKDIPPYRCYAGNPAKDISDKILIYREVSLDEKYSMMKGFIDEFDKKEFVRFKAEVRNDDIEDKIPSVIFTKKNDVTKELLNTTIFDLSNKTYNKLLTSIEISTIRFLLYSKARFYPR